MHTYDWEIGRGLIFNRAIAAFRQLGKANYQTLRWEEIMLSECMDGNILRLWGLVEAAPTPADARTRRRTWASRRWARAGGGPCTQTSSAP